ncbi:N-acetylmuramoyl-L-alanine amidase [Cetobacterium sp. 2A]|uniref:N-acetylmuramoyl-L-alanine amidase n=1 Tax=Cetobacterium sp. 2A TaxID=2754723 RepID=UPI00163CD348|nr:N-acetylmuramoyl-L-alanine amidase [Cetobacterium sp. 2A]MBC2855673.1 N-acetylmuramoyl-L-alanine amidase [Cetobacterium sp. 2A]
MLKKILFTLILLLISSCSSVNYDIDSKTYKATAKNSRIRFLIVHYTAINDQRSITALTGKNVSSHYLVTTDRKEPIYSLVPDLERAWHAGNSSFAGRNNINDSSIGIEIVNLGATPSKRKLHPQSSDFFIAKEQFIPYDPDQIRKVAFLLKTISQKYDIQPENILGHSDIAFKRKQDPGALFPWKELHDTYNIGAWYNKEDFNRYYKKELYSKYSIPEIKAEFRKYGYDMNDTDTWDLESTKAIYAFQMHFRPRNISGNMDLETFAILKALNRKYK